MMSVSTRRLIDVFSRAKSRRILNSGASSTEMRLTVTGPRGRRPFAARADHRAIQDPTIIDETRLLTQLHNTQARCHRAFACDENRADQQDFRVFPHGLGE